MTLRVAIAGCGKMGLQHARALRLSDAAEFTNAYQALVREAYPPREIGGRIVQVLPYRRIFAVGHRG